MLDAKAASDEEKRLMEWVEGGVVDALRKQYLKKLIFGISTDTDGQHVLEEVGGRWCSSVDIYL